VFRVGVVGITKTFGAANALSDVIAVTREKFTLVGESGAGKSTLVKIVTQSSNQGHIVDGEPTRHTPVEAAAGVAAVYQDRSCPHLTSRRTSAWARPR
jgi:ABC-type sugar transport system ATPase subunit